jgi:hypothetical protein
MASGGNGVCSGDHARYQGKVGHSSWRVTLPDVRVSIWTARVAVHTPRLRIDEIVVFGHLVSRASSAALPISVMARSIAALGLDGVFRAMRHTIRFFVPLSNAKSYSSYDLSVR